MSLLRDSLVALPLPLQLSEALLLKVKIIVERAAPLSSLTIVHLTAHLPDITQGTQTDTPGKKLDQKLSQATRRTMQLLRRFRWDLTYQQLLLHSASPKTTIVTKRPCGAQRRFKRFWIAGSMLAPLLCFWSHRDE
jgi:hypothetical protein